MRRWGALAALCLAAAAAFAAPMLTERQVKAAFLFNFAKFVEWPAFLPEEGAESPFVLGVWEGGPFEQELQRSLAGKLVHNRPIVVRPVHGIEDAKRTHVLFFPTARADAQAAVVSALAGNPTLTVGESRGFADQGGMIGFTMEKNRVRFNINATPAAAAGLRISSQLLKLAKNLEETAPRP